MNLDILLPITLVLGVVHAIQIVVEARSRRSLLLAAEGSPELATVLLRDQERQSRLGSLRWGIVLVALAAGFALVQWLGWQEIGPGLIAVLAGATGLGHLIFFAISRRQT